YGTHIDDSYVKVVFHSDGSISDKGFSLRLIPDYTEPSETSQLAGYTLSLSGDIGVNFMMNLTKAASLSSDTFMEFSMPGKTTERVYADQARVVDMGKNRYYGFPYHVSAKEMTETITAKYYEKGVYQDTYEYTVEDYANYMISHAAIFETKIVDIARAMLMYGKTTQQYFGYHTERLPKYNQTLYSPSLDSFKYYESAPGKIRFEGARLILKQKPGIKLYFSGMTSTSKVYVNREEVKKVKEGDLYYIVISDIDKMSTMYDIDSDDGYYLRYGIFSYGYKALTLDSSHQDLKNLISAMNLYNMAFWAVG
ncbi:MAG: hypothetical protein KBT48_05620, partial [Firmicutes bacterium]|nr:hypothetical protein [Bacillota bacterium]